MRESLSDVSYSLPHNYNQPTVTTERKSNQNQRRDHIYFHHDSHRRNFIVSIYKQTPVCNSNCKALHKVRDRCRNSDCQDLSEFLHVNMHMSRINRQLFTLFQIYPHIISVRRNIPDDCCNRGSAGSHTQYRNKNRI